MKAKARRIQMNVKPSARRSRKILPTSQRFPTGVKVQKETEDMFNPVNSSCLTTGTDGYNEKHDSITDGSASDDSISLLCDLNPIQSRGKMEERGLNLATNSKEQKNKRAISQVNRHSRIDLGNMTEYAMDNADNANHCQHGNINRLHKRDGNGDALIHKTCKRDVAYDQVLTQAGTNVNVEDIAGWTALHEASAQGNAVNELLNAGAHVNVQSQDRATSLHNAVSSGHDQVVNILLQHGSEPNSRNKLGLSTLVVAEQKEMKELLLTFNKSSTTQMQPDRICGESSTEANCDKQPPCHSSFSGTSNVEPRQTDDGDRTIKPADIPMRKIDTATNNLNQSVVVRQILAAVQKKQIEMSTWSLSQPQDGVKYFSAVTHIQNALAEVLVKQRLEKDKLARKYKSMTSSILRHGVKIQLISLSSRQRNFVRILQTQMDLVTLPDIYKCTTSHQNSQVVREQQSLLTQAPSSKMMEMEKGSQDKCNQLIPKRGSCGSIRQKTAAQTNEKVLTVLPSPFPSTTQQKLSEKMKTKRISQPRNSLQANKVQVKDNPLSHGRTEEHGKHLSQLIQKGLIPCGGVLQLLLKGEWHFACVQGDGSIKDSKGKSHLSPECWLQSILANNIPVSSTYAWDKVMFQCKPLSYFQNVADKGTSEVDVQHYSHGSTQETLTTVSGLNHLTAIRTVYLVSDEELIPNAVIDSYWKRLLQSDAPQL
ncbi:ankyrin repeat domain-containing protein 31-like [Dunckerocampus dactyliophorus]|uniref:ankyrin repeat domain-containing protein 31-like n=1 Tax=Dunckerocampus dactyliophorus TaxID=161453 RepID=UPI002407309F|nr:ankyrin repeat domain-containing protein 31-like [Dunckerocampus dactyliophorus]XP_054630985.1 ankyrin repeat domain-containing protein 31-like [Dunckerocampus dactyliophorus]